MTLADVFAASSYGPATQRRWLSTQKDASASWEFGDHDPPLASRTIKSRSAISWAIVTAWNPGGAAQSRQLNTGAQAKLRAAIQAQGYAPISAINGEGQWQEDSFLVLGVPAAAAYRWGQQFGQAAVLCGIGRRAALLWMNGDPPQRYWLTPHSGNQLVDAARLSL